eukprot:COSAG01_NODE_14_length_41020_cov_40.702133_39_plen_208_part_00
MIRICILDDHQIVREGLKKIIESCSDIKVIREASKPQQLLENKQDVQFDVLVLDLNFKSENGLSYIEELKKAYPERPIIVLSMYPSKYFAVPAFKQKVSAYLDKSCDTDVLIKAIHKVYSGDIYLTDEVKKILKKNINYSNNTKQQLSPRELEVLHLIIEGYSLTEIAEKLYISIKTVSTHRHHILSKLNLKNNVELTKYCISNSLG